MSRTNRIIIIQQGRDSHEFFFKNIPDYIPNEMLYQIITGKYKTGDIAK